MSTFTMTSPTTGGALPAGVTTVGGIVLDLIGLNGVRVLVQLSADQLFSGVFSPDAPNGNPGTIGVLGGLSPQVLAQLGGGLSQMAVRMTVFDADTSVGDVDHEDNTLTLNGIGVGNLSYQVTEATNEAGQPSGVALGFQNSALSTGWFHVTDTGVLNSVYNSLVANNGVSFGLDDRDPYDNGYDFTQGINGSHFEITVPNTAPDATDDVYTVSRNTPLVVGADAGLLANDTDPEGASLTATLVSGPSHGSVTINPDGSFTYVPNTGYSGPDSFSYRASDGALGDVAAVNLYVNENVAPVVGADSYTVDRNAELVVSAGDGVLANDVDIDNSGDPLTARVLLGPRNGTLTFNDDGSFVYVPRAGFHGTDSFAYAASDGEAESPTFVTLTVVNNNAAPEAADDAYRVDKNGTLTVEAADGVLANDADADADALTAEVITGPAHGQLTLHPDGSFTYVPNPGFHGPDSFTYRTSDDDDSDVATVTLTVDNVNGAPTAVNDAYQVDENGQLVIGPADGVLANDTDPDGSPMTAQIRTQPASGEVTLAEDGSFIYTPIPGFVGTDSFTYFANDGSDTGYATVVVTVNAVNAAPVGVADAYETTVNGELTVDAAAGVLANDSDPDGDALSVALVTGPQHGRFTLNADGSFVYLPDGDFVGTDSFTYSLRDGTVSTPVTVTLTVNPPVGNEIILDDNANRVSYRFDSEAVVVHALAGDDSVTGSEYADTLLLGEGDDEGVGGGGDDLVRGGAGNDKLFGQAGADRLEGGDGDDLMHGGDDADVMVGGRGDDTYYVHSAGDLVVEEAGEGNDNVRSTVSWVLGAHFEELLLQGSGDIDGAGNALDNAILGNSGENTLVGLDGDDILNGYGGDDLLVGGTGDDRLVGREGDDVMEGGAGDDQYYVDNQGDQIIEAEGEGYDIVFSTGSFVLGDHVEALYLDGEESIQGAGNALDNYIAGNDAANGIAGWAGDDILVGDGGDDLLVGGDGDDRLYGGEGGDTLSGSKGADWLEGGSGDDTFLFERQDFDGAIDHVADFHGAGTSDTGEQDVLALRDYGAGSTLVFDHYGPTESHQYYRVVDPENPDAGHFILVETVGTTNLLTPSDYIFL